MGRYTKFNSWKIAGWKTFQLFLCCLNVLDWDVDYVRFRQIDKNGSMQCLRVGKFAVL